MRAFNDTGELLRNMVSLSVFSFYALILAVPRGYTVGAFLLLVCSICYIARTRHFALSAEDKLLASLLTCIFLMAILSFLYHGDRWRSLDLPSRYMLAVPILILTLHVPVRLSWLWAGLIAGCFSGAAVALWELQIDGAMRADGFTGVIQFGDLGLVMGSLCGAGLFWATIQGQYAKLWKWSLVAAALAGATVSIASGSRGGWIALPIIVVLFSIAFLSKRNFKNVLAFGAVVCACIAILVASVPSVKVRYTAALTDVQQYNEGVANTSVGLRLAMWHALSKVIPQRPILGWSEAAYQDELRRLVDEKKADPNILILANTHNNYLEIWVSQGIIGLLLIIALLVITFIAFCRRLRSDYPAVRSLALSGAVLVASYAVFCMSQIMLGRNNTLLFFLVSVACFWGSLRHTETSSLLGAEGPRRPES